MANGMKFISGPQQTGKSEFDTENPQLETGNPKLEIGNSNFALAQAPARACSLPWQNASPVLQFPVSNFQFRFLHRFFPGCPYHEW
jgi:hypothetical protein